MWGAIMKKYLKMIGWVILYLLAYMAVTTAVELLIGIGYFMFNYKELLSSNMGIINAFANKIQQNAYVLVLFSAICTLPLFYYICKQRNEDIFKICKIKKLELKQIVKIVIVILGAACFTTGLVDILSTKIQSYSQVTSSLNQIEHIILSYIAILFVAPLLEEVLFRGLVFNELKKNLNVFLAIVIQGVLFGIYHMNLLQGIYAAILGIVLGFINYCTGTILSSIIGHICFNFLGTIGLVMLFSYFKFLEYPLMVIGLIVSIILIVNMVKEKRKLSSI